MSDESRTNESLAKGAQRSAAETPKNYAKPCLYSPTGSAEESGTRKPEPGKPEQTKIVNETMAPRNGVQHDML